MDSTAEVQALQHQLELARRAARMIYDQPTLDRLEQYVNALTRRLAEVRRASAEEETRRRAHQLWRDAGCPAGRDMEFWVRAEWELGKSDQAEQAAA